MIKIKKLERPLFRGYFELLNCISPSRISCILIELWRKEWSRYQRSAARIIPLHNYFLILTIQCNVHLGEANIDAKGGNDSLTGVGTECGEHAQLATMPSRIMDGKGQGGAHGHGEEKSECGEGTETANAGQDEAKGNGGNEEKPKENGQAQVKSNRRTSLAVPAMMGEIEYILN